MTPTRPRCIRSSRHFHAALTCVVTAWAWVTLSPIAVHADDAARIPELRTVGSRLIEVPTDVGSVHQLIVRHRPSQAGDTPAPHGGCPQNTISLSTALWETGTTVSSQAGLLEGEWCAATYNIPTSEFPIKIITAEALLSAPSITGTSHTEWGVGFWQGTPATGSEIVEYHSDGTVIPHLDHPIGQNVAAIISFGIDPSELADQIYINAEVPGNPTNSISVGFKVDQHNNQLATFPGFCDVACSPSLGLCDGNNMMYSTDTVPPSGAAVPTRNWIFGINCGGACFTGWKNFSQISSGCRPTGDWMIRVTYEANCVIAPTITGVVPPSASNAGPTTLQIQGSNFNGATLARLTKAGQPSITGVELSVGAGNNSVTATFDLTGAVLGLWDVEVATPGGTGSLAGAFTVTAPLPPTIDFFTPGNENNDRIRTVTVQGTEFVAGGTAVKLIQGGTTLTATNVNVTSPTTLTCNFDLHCVPTGPYTGQVTTAYGTANQGTAFLVTTPPFPTVFGADVTDTANCPGSINMTVFGADLASGVAAFLVRSGQPDVPATTVVFNDATSINATFDTAVLLTGAYNLKVVNPDCDQATSSPLDWQLTVAACIPSVSTVTPNSTTNHQSSVALTIGGSNFVTGATVKLTRAGQPDIVATGVSVPTAAQITCTVNPQLAQIGLWRVVVTNPGGAVSTQNVNLSITAGPAPTVSLVTPANPTNCGVYNCTILGTNYAFATGVSAQLELAGQPNIVATNVVRVSSTQLTASFNLTGVATTPTSDKWDCRVSNPDGQNGLGLNRVNVIDCPASCTKGDINADTLRNGRDVADFTRVYLNPGAATTSEQCSADLVAPAGVEANDVPAFVNCLLTGACP